jgi:methylenetetrahydrofolate dehydrogenase (NADP+) / methenyltetrahydrofolate cyclohydrolase
MKINGKTLATRGYTQLKKKNSPTKKLVGVLIGSDKSSLSYLKSKKKEALKLGITFQLKRFSARISEKKICEEIKKLSNSSAIGGIVIQLPIPKKYSRATILNCVSPDKDPDCLTATNIRKFMRGTDIVKPVPVEVIEEILKHLKVRLRGKSVVIIGAGKLIGKPLSLWPKLKKEAKNISIYTKTTKNLRTKLKNTDIILSGAGSAHIFDVNDIRKGVLVIDFGYDTSSGKARGDFNPAGARNINYTPTPGGTGPLVIAKLLENFYKQNTVDKKERN